MTKNNISEEANKTQEIKLPIGVTMTQVEAWKKKHGVLKLIEVTDDEDNIHSAIFKQPDIDILSAVTAKTKEDEVGGVMLMYNSCKLAADEAIEADISLKLAVTKRLKDLIKQRTATIKKL